MREAQLHNDYACELARRRAAGLPAVGLDEYRRTHRSHRWPGSWLFAMDCKSIVEYRVAIAEISDGHPVRGRARLAYAAMCSPLRTVERIGRMVAKRLR